MVRRLSLLSARACILNAVSSMRKATRQVRYFRPDKSDRSEIALGAAFVIHLES